MPDLRAEYAALRGLLDRIRARIEPTIIERDAERMRGEIRRAKAAQARIDDLLQRLDDEQAQATLGRPLAQARRAGMIEWDAASRRLGIAADVPAVAVNRETVIALADLLQSFLCSTKGLL